MPRGIDRVKIKAVIDALRKRKRGWSELKQKTSIADKSLARILNDYLKFWGLAEKVRDEKGREKWSWVENIKVYRTIREYDLDLSHSKKLLPALDAILAEDPALCRDQSAVSELRFRGELQFKEFILQHLETEYPDIYELVLKHRDILKKWYKYLEKTETQYKREIDNWISEQISEGYRATRAREYWRRQWKNRFEGAILRKVRPLIFEISVLGSGREDPVLKFLPSEVKERAITVQTKRCRIFRDLSTHLNELRLKVNMGRPMDGQCDSCPRIRIVSRKARAKD